MKWMLKKMAAYYYHYEFDLNLYRYVVEGLLYIQISDLTGSNISSNRQAVLEIVESLVNNEGQNEKG
jgi:hypothetical protein